MNWFFRLFRWRSREEIRKEVSQEPKVERALKELKRVDPILKELQMLEGKRR